MRSLQLFSFCAESFDAQCFSAHHADKLAPPVHAKKIGSITLSSNLFLLVEFVDDEVRIQHKDISRQICRGIENCIFSQVGVSSFWTLEGMCLTATLKAFA